jgi:hypothetical protein
MAIVTQSKGGPLLNPRCRKLGTRRFKQLFQTAAVLHEASDLLAEQGETYASLILLRKSQALMQRANAVMDQWDQQQGRR